MKQFNIDIEYVLGKMTASESKGKTAMLAAGDGVYARIIAVANTMKETFF